LEGPNDRLPGRCGMGKSQVVKFAACALR
jgi:hypothetical protein